MARLVIINIMGNEHNTQLVQGLLHLSVEIKNNTRILSKRLECDGIRERLPQSCFGSLDGLEQLGQKLSLASVLTPSEAHKLNNGT